MPSLDELREQAARADAEDRREAALALGRTGPEGVPLLVRLLGDADWRVRKTAVEALAARGGPEIIAALIDRLHSHDNAGARNSAIEALVRIGRDAVDALLPLLRHRDPDVRKFAVDILGDIGDRRATSGLITGLADKDENVGVACAEALGKLRDPAAVDPLLACLNQSTRGWLDYAAAEALGAIGDQRALGPLLTALNRSSLREPVLEALGKIGNADTLGPLLAGLADPIRIVREVAVAATAAIWRNSAEPARRHIAETVRAEATDRAADALEEILVSNSGELRKAAIMLLGWAGRERSLRKLLLLLTEEDLLDPTIRALGSLDPDRAGFLLEYLTSDNGLVRRAAAQAAGELRLAGAEDSLIALLADENGHVRSAAAEALGRLRSAKARTSLLALLRDEYASVQESAIRALGAIGDGALIDELVRDFSARDAALRRNIVLLLGHFPDERVADLLLFAMKDAEPVVRKAVIQSLGAVPGGKSLKALLLAITDDDPEVRMLAAEALAGSDDPHAQEALFPLLEDADLWVRAAAARGLAKGGGERAGAALTAHLETAADIFLLAIVDVLGRLRYAPARGHLLRLTTHADPEIRKAALTALGEYGGATARDAAAASLGDGHWSVRKAAIDVLARDKSAAAQAHLARVAEHDPDPIVRRAAREALES